MVKIIEIDVKSDLQLKLGNEAAVRAACDLGAVVEVSTQMRVQ